MKRVGKKNVVALFLALVLALGLAPAGLAESVSRNPLVDPQPITSYTETEDEILNVLLLGVDLGFDGYWGSGGKRKLMDCHADTYMVVSFNKTKGRIDFVSIPRDTLNYVPGVRGIYKLNAAFNCATTPEEGIQHCMDSASRILGGIKIDRYCLVDMGALVALGEVLGGVEFEMDMNYTGSSGTKFRRGLQHLDAVGITDYVRARTNATVDGHDIGRTRRSRSMMIAVMQKIQQNTDLIKPLHDMLVSGEENIFTNVTMEDIHSLLPFILEVDSTEIGSHVITGKYRLALIDWNFTFTDQAHRLTVLKDVYGLDAEEIPYVSREYTTWLEETGLRSVRNIQMARQVIAHGKALENPTEKQQKVLNELIAAHDALVAAFDKAADSLASKDTSAMVSARGALRDVGEEAVEVLEYPKNLSWRSNPLWYEDAMVNEYNEINWR